MLFEISIRQNHNWSVVFTPEVHMNWGGYKKTPTHLHHIEQQSQAILYQEK